MQGLQKVQAETKLQRGVERITLSNFRCYDSFSLSLKQEPVVITGPNGSGKTNLLEAISFLIPGKGLRRARLQDIRNRAFDKPWSLSFGLYDEGHSIQIGTGLDPENPETERRVVKVNGEKLKSQLALSEWVSIVWLTPQMDRLFMEGPQGRRRFLDRIVYGFDPGHATRLNRYERALKERNTLLKQGRIDARWFESLEETLVQEGVAIAAARREGVGQLSQVLKERKGAFPVANLSMQGDIEEFLLENSAAQVEEILRNAYIESREQDRLTGRTSIGPHRSDLEVFYSDKELPAAFCSTGEQKALLLSIVMASAHLLSIRTGAIPLLLLDEVIAHLDENRRTALFDAILELRIQAYLTGTDVSYFEGLQGRAQFLGLQDAKLIS